MKCFSTFGLLVQVIFVIVSNVCGDGDEKEKFEKANGELLKETTESFRDILNAHNTVSLQELDYPLYGAETLMLYLNNYVLLKHDNFKCLKQDIIKAINSVKGETERCLEDYSAVLENIVDRVTTSRHIAGKEYLRQAEELEMMRNQLILAKNLYVECAPKARINGMAALKERIVAVLESEELHRGLGLTADDFNETKLSPRKLQNQLHSFLAELSFPLSKGEYKITNLKKTYERMLVEMNSAAVTAKYLMNSYQQHNILNFRTDASSPEKQPTHTTIKDFRKRIDKCNETAKKRYKVNLNEPVFQRLSILRGFCAEIPSSKCTHIMEKINGNILSHSLELFKVRLDEKKFEMTALFEICVDGAFLDKTQEIRFSD